MRAQTTAGPLTLRAIAGTHVVLLGWDMAEAACPGILGFALHRYDPVEDEAYWLRGLKTFAETDPGFVAGSDYSTRDHPIQSFLWADYTAKPGRPYVYRVVALGGTPRALVPTASVAVAVTTEAVEGSVHAVHFNRGLAASQAYARRFGDQRPQDVGAPAFRWLSRGLEEAMVRFVAETGAGDGLLVAAYEFRHAPFLDALRAAVDRGVALRVVYDDRNARFPGPANREAAETAGIAAFCVPRQRMVSAIAHNKFVVRLRRGEPEAVWTGGANFSAGGIFGQSNVGEAVRDAALARAYAAYFDLIADDPTNAELRPRIDALNPDPAGPPSRGNGVVFSPRRSLAALDWYAELGQNAGQALFMTFAFGMNERFRQVYATATAPLRFALMERATGSGGSAEARAAEAAEIAHLRRRRGNLFAIGGQLSGGLLDRWLAERLTGLNTHVRYVHNKFMLVDPLTPDPIVVAGSANFSVASTTTNDENMLVVRGNERVADVYLGEFMRLYSHHAFREFVRNQPDPTPHLKHLRTDDWWRHHFGVTSQARRRVFFAGTA